MKASASKPERRVPIIPAFTILVLLGFSDEFLSAIIEATGRDYNENFRWLLAPVDGVLLMIIAVQAWRFQCKLRMRTVLWWLAGAATTVTLDTLAAQPKLIHVLWFDLAASVAYVAALTILFAATMGVSPLMFLLSGARRSDDWLLVRAATPLLIGTLGAYLATEWFEYWLAPTGGVDPEFFAQLSQVIALLIVALGIEVGFFRELITDPRQRPMAILSVSVVCLGEGMALSVLTANNDRIFPWHAYLAFILTVYACLVALASLIWVLVVRPVTAIPEHTHASEPAPSQPAPVEATVAEPGKGAAVLAVGLVAVGAVAALTWRRLR